MVIEQDVIEVSDDDKENEDTYMEKIAAKDCNKENFKLPEKDKNVNEITFDGDLQITQVVSDRKCSDESQVIVLFALFLLYNCPFQNFLFGKDEKYPFLVLFLVMLNLFHIKKLYLILNFAVYVQCWPNY